MPQGLHDVLVAHRATAEAVGKALNNPSKGGSNDDNDDDAITPDLLATMACPCEVSLGIGGTYFIRFLDGRVDYSLPNFVADVFDKFESDGKLIRNVSLHVETYDCLIRYSKERF